MKTGCRSCQSTQRLSTTSTHTNQQSVTPGLLQYSTDTWKVLQNVSENNEKRKEIYSNKNKINFEDLYNIFQIDMVNWDQLNFREI